MHLQVSKLQTAIIREQLHAFLSTGLNKLEHTVNHIFLMADRMHVEVDVSTDDEIDQIDPEIEVESILKHFGISADWENNTASLLPGQMFVNKFPLHSTEHHVRIAMLTSIGAGQTDKYANVFALAYLRAKIDNRYEAPGLEDSYKWHEHGIPSDLANYVTQLGFSIRDNEVVPEFVTSPNAN
jgi:hypothetical protein